VVLPESPEVRDRRTSISTNMSSFIPIWALVWTSFAGGAVGALSVSQKWNVEGQSSPVEPVVPVRSSGSVTKKQEIPFQGLCIYGGWLTIWGTRAITLLSPTLSDGTAHHSIHWHSLQYCNTLMVFGAVLKVCLVLMSREKNPMADLDWQLTKDTNWTNLHR
jgi:hypothetical protein